MKLPAVLLILLLISGCQSPVPASLSAPGTLPVYSVHARSQSTRIKMVILHYTAEDNARSLQILTQGPVSAHYLITSPTPETPTQVYQLVAESQAAWHAGISGWQGQTSLNSVSIGIELVNPGYHRDGTVSQCSSFSPAQIHALEQLLRQLVARYQLSPQQILGHSDVSPGRKQDPGPCFPWQALAKDGFGAWPDPVLVRTALGGRSPWQASDPQVLGHLLRRFGYPLPVGADPEQQQAVFRAFQMHFRPALISGRADAGSEAIAKALVEQYRPAEPGADSL